MSLNDRRYSDDKELLLLAELKQNQDPASVSWASQWLAYVLKETRALRHHIDMLEAQLEMPPRFEGKYEQGLIYKRGALVSHEGGMWHCSRITKACPGKAMDWVLVDAEQYLGAPPAVKRS